MSNAEQPLSIQILDKCFVLKCPSEKASDLQESARYVDTMMRSAIKGKPTSPHQIERAALMTAINIAYELIEQKRQEESYLASMTHRLEALQTKVENTLRLRDE